MSFGFTSLALELLTAPGRARAFTSAAERQASAVRDEQALQTELASLSRALLGPVAAQLADPRARKLMIVPDGVLQYVPFAALPEPKREAESGRRREGELKAHSPSAIRHPPASAPLITKHELIALPSAATLSVLRAQLQGRPLAPKRLAVVADPVFEPTDARVAAARQSAPSSGLMPAQGVAMAQPRGAARSGDAANEEPNASAPAMEEAGGSLARLSFTRVEAQAIAALVPATERRVAFDFDATRELVVGAALADYQYLHFATHGLLNQAQPELSGLALSLVDAHGERRDGFLRALDVYQLKLPAELVVLSGCRTGLGRELRGEGLIGLTRGFMYAGARRVMASLWNVNDAATAELMRYFYGAMFGPRHLAPAAALRQAQLAMSQSRQWRAPYHWAAFGRTPD